MLWTVLIGARIFMDNMLYIIAGLVIILLIGVWLLRKNKAQRPTNQSSRQDSSTPLVAPSHHSTASARTNTATMFDDITVAQRFIDQQRYDKAIETLERGLSQKPNDSALSLKLLNVYALSNNNEAFYNTYDAITAHGDMATIAQASQLKELLDEEQDTQASTALTYNNKADITLNGDSVSAPDDSNTEKLALAYPKRTTDTDDVSLDFHFPTSNINNESAATPVSDNDINHQDNILNNTFDLTLDDLEATDETILFESAPLSDTKDDAADDLLLDFDTIKNSNQIQPVTDSSPINDSNDQIESDFELDFESLLNDSANTETRTEQVDSFIDNDLILSSDKYEPLVLDIGNETSTNAPAPSIDNIEVETVNNDFSLILDDVIDEEASVDAISNDDTSVSSVANTEIAPNINVTRENPVMFGDDSDIEALDFDIDSDELIPAPLTEAASTKPISRSVVLSDDNTDTDLSTDFAAQFAADFAFVDDLDSHQITLNLADQYLQLGEYDSAKRLLEEVVAQGNPEQQKQAQMLLARTA